MFQILKKNKQTKARIGVIKTKNGVIKTPFFMPDATRGYVKNLSSQDLNDLQTPAMVINTYYLYLQPGVELIKKFKKIHQFMNWSKPLLSDSGGYQVFSLIHKKTGLGKITDQEIIFKSPLDGSKHKLSPEKSIAIQFDLGVDMMVCLDDCPPNGLSKEETKQAVQRTIDWAKRCKNEYNKQIKNRKLNKKNKPLLFAVIQGGEFLSLRKYCTQELIKIGFDGYSFGARPIDNQGKFLKKVLAYTADLIPENLPRFALGVGKPEDIVRCFQLGWDMFDCVIPTREGRHGRLFYFLDKPFFTKNNRLNKFYQTININNTQFKNDKSAINENSKIKDLQNYSKAYLHYLFKAKDPLGTRLASLNNLEFYKKLMDLL